MHYPNYGQVLTFREGNYLVRYGIDCTKLMYHGNTFQLADQISLRNWFAILRSPLRSVGDFLMLLCYSKNFFLMLFKELFILYVSEYVQHIKGNHG